MMLDEPKITEAFRTGKGVGWNERSECLFCGTARFFRTGYKHHLVQEWLPALEGVVDKLKRGAKVADVGCGHGVSTLLMAEAFPNSAFFGFDYHEGSIDARARSGRRRRRLGRACQLRGRIGEDVSGRTATISSASSIACTTWAIRSARISHVRETMAADGTCMLVEPFANDRLEDNLNPVGRLSTMRHRP